MKVYNNRATNNSKANFLKVKSNLLLEESSTVIFNNGATLNGRAIPSQTTLKDLKESLHKSTTNFNILHQTKIMSI